MHNSHNNIAAWGSESPSGTFMVFCFRLKVGSSQAHAKQHADFRYCCIRVCGFRRSGCADV